VRSKDELREASISVIEGVATHELNAVDVVAEEPLVREVISKGTHVLDIEMACDALHQVDKLAGAIRRELEQLATKGGKHLALREDKVGRGRRDETRLETCQDILLGTDASKQVLTIGRIPDVILLSKVAGREDGTHAIIDDSAIDKWRLWGVRSQRKSRRR
jgi:hypothetical protein